MAIRGSLGGALGDLRFVARSLRRDRLVAAFIVVTLALAIGANAAMYGVIDRLVLRGPDHIRDPGSVLRLYRTVPVNSGSAVTVDAFGWVSYESIRRQSSVFAGVGAYSIHASGQVFGEGADAQMIPVGAATRDLFPTLDVRPAIGRFFAVDEDAPAAPQYVAVLSHGLWRRAFGGDSGAIGSMIRLGGAGYRVVGVAPAGFTGPQLTRVDVWVPLSLRSQGNGVEWRSTWSSTWLRIVVRLKPGVTAEQASEELTRIHRASYAGNDLDAHAARLSVAPLRYDDRGRESVEASTAQWLVVVTGLVLLIAIANVVNLLLARAIRRRRDTVVMIALGAGTGRIARIALVEGTLFAAAGTAIGLFVAWGIAAIVRTQLLPGVAWSPTPIGPRVVVAAVLIGLATAVATGLLTMSLAGRPDLFADLTSRTGGKGPRAARARSVIAIAQSALSAILLVGAGLFVMSLYRARTANLGIEPDRVIVIQARFAGSSGLAAEVVRRKQVLAAALERATRLPTIERASLAVGLPFQSSFGRALRVPGWDSIPRMPGGGPHISAVAANYFATVGTPLVEGRTFFAHEGRGTEPVVIVSRTMAITLWPGRSSLGECVYWSASRDSLNTCSRVVGVVGDAKVYNLREERTMHYYVPIGQEGTLGVGSIIARARIGTEGITIEALRGLLLAIDPSISYVTGAMLQAAVEPQYRRWQLGAALFVLLGALALVVASVGVYSVMNCIVEQRTHEIGVRLALGAQRASIARLVVGNGVVLCAAGVAGGVLAAIVVSPFIEPMLFETPGHDPIVLGGVAMLMLAVATAACAMPATRAMRGDPAGVLQGR